MQVNLSFCPKAIVGSGSLINLPKRFRVKVWVEWQVRVEGKGERYQRLTSWTVQDLE